MFVASVAVLFWMFHSASGYRNDGPPQLLVRPDSRAVPVDTAVVLFCRATGDPLPNIMWLSDGHIITDSRFKIKTLPDALSILRIDAVRFGDANRTLSCTAENGIGQPIKAESRLTVLGKEELPAGFPVIEAHPVMKSVESGRTAHLSCRVSGNPTPRVLWLKNSVPVDIRTEPRYSVSTLGNPGALMIQKATEADQGKYECVASNERGAVHSRSVHLFVKERQNPPYFSFKLPPVHRVVTGGSVNLTCVAVGYPMPRVFWRRQSDGVILNDPQTAPIGRNVLTVSDVRRTESYKCVAVSKLGSIGASTVVQPEGAYVAVPSPQNLRVADLNATAVLLRWDAVRAAEAIAKFVVRFRPKFSDGVATERDFFDPKATEALIGDLQTFQHYEFTVQTETQSGKRSVPSTAAEAHTAIQTADASPRDVQLRSLRDGDAVLVEWSPPSDESPYGRVAAYSVGYSNNQLDWRIKEIGNRDLATTLTEISRRPLYVRVRAHNAHGVSPWSPVAELGDGDRDSAEETREWTTRLAVIADNVPSAPRSLEVHQYNATAYRVAWSPPEFPNGQLFGYYVYQDKLVNGAPIANGRRKAAVLLNKDANNTLITDFEHNTEYVIRVNAFNANGDGEYASSAHFITGKSPPRPPRPQSVSLLDENPPLRARVEWLPAVNPSDGSTAPIDGYIVMFRAVGESEWRNAEADADARGVLLESLRMGTEYELQIASFNADGRSENVTERLNTPIGRPSAVPLNVRYSVNGDKIAFQWDPPEVGRRNGPVIAYHAVLACSDNTPPRHQNVSRLWTTYSIDVRKSYGFRVAATTAKGDGPFSDQIQIRPADSGEFFWVGMVGEWK